VSDVPQGAFPAYGCRCADPKRARETYPVDTDVHRSSLYEETATPKDGHEKSPLEENRCSNGVPGFHGFHGLPSPPVVPSSPLVLR